MSVQQTAPQGEATPAASRRGRTHTARQRNTRWVDVAPDTTLASVLDRLPVPPRGTTVVGYLVGELPGRGIAGFRTWAFDAPEGWDGGGHYLARLTDPVLRYTCDATGGRVELHRGGVWFGKQDGYTAAEASDAATMLRDVVRTVWMHDTLPMLTTPSAWGRDLWLRTITHGTTYPTLPPELQRLIRGTSGQGRWQSPGGDGLAGQGPTVAGVTVYDMRFGYGGMLSGLGVGPWTHDDRPKFDPWQRGRYRVSCTVPAGWDHLGLLAVPNDDGHGWHYPNRPGERFDTWADGAELALAQRYGWSFTVAERIVGTEGRPLNLFRDRMVGPADGRDNGARNVRRLIAEAHRDDPEVAKLAAAAARTLVLHTVGSFHTRGHDVTRTVPWNRRELIPADVAPTEAGPVWTWTETRPAAWPETQHPEWSAAVYARARARVLDHRGIGALTVPFRDVLAVHSDAVYLARDPRWSDDRKVGSLRREVSRPGPHPTPTRRSELIRLRDGHGPTCTGCAAAPTIFPPDGSRWCVACHPGWEDTPARVEARGGARAHNAPARVGATQQEMTL